MALLRSFGVLLISELQRYRPSGAGLPPSWLISIAVGRGEGRSLVKQWASSPLPPEFARISSRQFTRTRAGSRRPRRHARFPRDQVADTVRLAERPGLAQQPPVHAREEAFTLSQLSREQCHALDKSRVRQFSGGDVP